MAVRLEFATTCTLWQLCALFVGRLTRGLRAAGTHLPFKSGSRRGTSVVMLWSMVKTSPAPLRWSTRFGVEPGLVTGVWKRDDAPSPQGSSRRSLTGWSWLGRESRRSLAQTEAVADNAKSPESATTA